MTRLIVILMVTLCVCSCGDFEKDSQAYETDLTERCKDWLYWREQILVRHQNGDIAGADEARRNMNAFMHGLEINFTSEQITNEMVRLKESAATKRIKPWSSGAGQP